jgi:hypothetical protein
MLTRPETLQSMHRHGRKFALLAALMAISAVGEAQFVRGMITERNTGAPLAGVLVTLERLDADSAAPSTTLASVLSNEQGEYAVRAGVAGRYRIDAKRIGVKRYSSEPLTLSAGETRRVDVQLDGLLFVLPEVQVEVRAICAARPNQARQVAALWDEARTALTATRISSRDRLVRARISRYLLAIDPDNIGTIHESLNELEASLDRLFTSLSADSLAQVGFWQDMPGDSVEFYGPDAEVLLSDAFRRDHCYTVVDGGRERRGVIGLSFEPAVRRPLPDVRGTLWLDARTFDLRFIEFRYTRLPYGEASNRVGGEVHFARLDNGAWIVRRWFIRMPQYRRNTAAPAVLREAFDSLATIYRLMEEGGSITVEGLGRSPSPATLTGAVVDSTGRPFGGALVRLAGTPYGATVDPRGRYRLDSLPPGAYSLIVEHDGYTLFGTVAAQAYVSLGEGASVEANMRAARSRQIIAGMCRGRRPEARRATLRVIMLDSASTEPFPNVPFRVSWAEAGSGVTWQEQRLTGTTDRTGAVNFCGLPARVPLEVVIERPGTQPLRVSVLQLAPNQMAAHVVYARKGT